MSTILGAKKRVARMSPSRRMTPRESIGRKKKPCRGCSLGGVHERARIQCLEFAARRRVSEENEQIIEPCGPRNRSQVQQLRDLCVIGAGSLLVIVGSANPAGGKAPASFAPAHSRTLPIPDWWVSPVTPAIPAHSALLAIRGRS